MCLRLCICFIRRTTKHAYPTPYYKPSAGKKYKYVYLRKGCDSTNEKVCGSDLNFYDTKCVAEKHGITEFKPSLLCEQEIIRRKCLEMSKT